MNNPIISMVHGSGGQATGQLIHDIFSKEFQNDILNQMEDAAIVSGSEQIAMTTDSFVVTPLEYPGGDIGRLCVCGTVNDLLMRGAIPKYMTCGFILEEGLQIEQLKGIVHSMAETAREAGVQIVAGDTKVIEGNGGLYINTTGVGIVLQGYAISASGAQAGDAILVSGDMGDHHAAILSQRMSIENRIESDNAPLGAMVDALRQGGVKIHAMRDITRGGLATVLKELAEASKTCFMIEEAQIPVSAQVKDFCGLLGLDPLYMGNEGKMAVIVPAEEAELAVKIMRETIYGQHAARIGQVLGSDSDFSNAFDGRRERSRDSVEEYGNIRQDPPIKKAGSLILRTPIGGLRSLSILQGEGLPRIC